MKKEYLSYSNIVSVTLCLPVTFYQKEPDLISSSDFKQNQTRVEILFVNVDCTEQLTDFFHKNT